MVQNKQSFSTFPALPSPSFSWSPASSMLPPAIPPSHSGIPTADQLTSPPSTTFKSIFGGPTSNHHLHSSSSTPSMGQVVSRPEVNTTLSPSSAPSALGVSASNTGSLFKRAFTGRRKKSDTLVLSSQELDKGREPQIDETSHGSTGTVPRQLGTKQLTLQLAQHVFNKKSAPASPAMSGLSLPPPPPPPKHAQQPTPSSSLLTPINTNIDKRSSTITASSPIVPALDYMRKSDEHTEQVALKENERKDLERSESKDVRRKSDSTLSLHTIRPTIGSRTPRPISLAESLHSTHTIVPVNKRLSALITDAEYVMAEEDDGTSNDEKAPKRRTSPASSLRLRDRRSQSLNLGPPLSMMVSSPTTSNATMSLEAITVTLPRSVSEGCELERLVTGEMATTTLSSLPSDTTRDAVVRHVSAISSLNQLSATLRAERILPDLPDPPQRTTSPPQPHSPHPSFRQTAISITSGFAPAAGLARRAVERMGRVWGSKSSFSSPLASPLGESFNGHTGTVSRTSSSHSEFMHHGHSRKVRHNPQTPSVSSTASSLSDYEGPQLGKCLRGPICVSPSGSVVGGLVFGRDLKACVAETAVDSILSIIHSQHVAHYGREEAGSQPPVPLGSRHVPALVTRCAEHILAWGIQEQGLFRYVV